MTIGVNLSGAEFGSGDEYGVDYIYPSAENLDYYQSQGVTLIRLPVSWERLQPTLGGELDTAELQRLTDFLDAAAERGMTVIVDVHNYGRYDGNVIGSEEVPNEVFADFWLKMATALEGHPGVEGYGLMNEPHDMGGVDVWPTAAQAAVDAIRTVDTDTNIYVAGNNWSGAQSWTTYNDNLDISDPSNKIIYEAHLYFDANHDGVYDSYSSEGATAFTGVEGLVDFLDWLDETGNKGFIGEFGVPSDDPAWLTVMSNFLSLLNTAGVSSTVWGGGPWWGDYDLSVEPVDGEDSPQMELIADFLDGTTPTSTMLIGTKSNNVLTGNIDSNFMYGRAGNDQLYGASGHDVMYGGIGNDYLDGGAGRDKMYGGLGDDYYVVDNYSDSVKEELDEGIDTVKSSLTYTLGANVENLTLIGTAAIDGTGNALDNVMKGNDAANKFVAGDGNDTLTGGGGDDKLYGNDGNDRLDGGLGIDNLSGGNGADTYVFSSVAGADGDTVANFVSGTDVLDFSAIDAKTSTAADDAFTFIGNTAFTQQEGQLRLALVSGKLTIQGDVNGDGIADFTIKMPSTNVIEADLIL